MSLPNYLAKIKSSGVYPFVWDKSIVPPQQAETLRLVVGYSEKGPFNTPVYIESVSDFISIYGNISKKLERKGIFFHRMAIQALSAGPILALNLKPFTSEPKEDNEAEKKKYEKEKVQYVTFNCNGVQDLKASSINVSKIYDTNRFWKLDEDLLPSNITDSKYITISATDTKDASCSIFIRKYAPKSFDLTIRQWYNENSSEEMPSYLESIQDKKLNDYFAEVYVFRGEFTEDIIQENGPFGYFDKDNNWIGCLKTVDEKICVNQKYVNIYGEEIDALEELAGMKSSNFIAKYQGCLIPYFKDAMGNYDSLDILFNSDYNSHKMLMKMDESVLESADNVVSYISLTQMDEISPILLNGYEYSTIDKKDTGKVLQSEILRVLDDKGIRTALTNRVDCEYHYIVDSFQSYIEAGCKGKLAQIAKEKDNAFAILNFPPMPEFVKDSNFESDVTGKFDITKISEQENGFSLVSESNGASYCAYYTGVVFGDGALKQNIPSAALVSNRFMEKWGPRQPYYIVAGPNYGRIEYDGLIGPDYNYGRSDLDVLEPMGVNAIIYIPRKGTYINSNQTAKQLPVSALSKVHVRELIIYLQNEIESMLQNYQWELNTQALRDVVKAKADVILENVKNNGGVYAYVNVCDSTNNTPEVIDNEMIILDTAIEPARGAGKMVFQLSIHKTGGITSATV